MKTQIRYGVWETNSSSVNTLTVMTPEEYEEYKYKWYSEDWMWDNNITEDWVHAEDVHDKKYRYSENPCNNEWRPLEKQMTTYTTEHGDEVVVISIYGRD